MLNVCAALQCSHWLTLSECTSNTTHKSAIVYWVSIQTIFFPSISFFVWPIYLIFFYLSINFFSLFRWVFVVVRYVYYCAILLAIHKIIISSYHTREWIAIILITFKFLDLKALCVHFFSLLYYCGFWLRYALSNTELAVKIS